jgi:hypothetical protein
MTSIITSRLRNEHLQRVSRNFTGLHSWATGIHLAGKPSETGEGRNGMAIQSIYVALSSQVSDFTHHSLWHWQTCSTFCPFIDD